MAMKHLVPLVPRLAYQTRHLTAGTVFEADDKRDAGLLVQMRRARLATPEEVAAYEAQKTGAAAQAVAPAPTPAPPPPPPPPTPTPVGVMSTAGSPLVSAQVADEGQGQQGGTERSESVTQDAGTGAESGETASAAPSAADGQADAAPDPAPEGSKAEEKPNLPAAKTGRSRRGG
jgi:hypothetical protein